jgi:hypothetical protein
VEANGLYQSERKLVVDGALRTDATALHAVTGD